jgi:hypothetical protein
MRTILLILAAAAALAVAGAAAAAGHPAILAALNSERAANGIPARVRENPGWSAKCAEHVAYMAATGSFSHSESPASPKYAANGSWAGRHSVLAMGSSWQEGDPFASAPLHLIQLMSPELRQVGVDEDASGYLCMTTWPGYESAGWKKPTVYSYPGNGAAGVPYAETADELEFVPGDFVGLPRGTTTGFNIMVFAEGTADPWHLHIVAATVTGPGGPVELRTVDRTTPTVGRYLPPGSGFLIPVAPLQPGAVYRASVRFAGGLRHTWHFRTAEQ